MSVFNPHQHVEKEAPSQFLSNYTMVSIPKNNMPSSILFYILAICSHPVEQLEDSVRVIGYEKPALRGTNVTLACPTGMTLNGSDTLTCMGNGEWEPDPNKPKCKNESIVQISKQGMLSQDGKIAVASSVTVFIVASILFFIVGFLCGHFCQKSRKPASVAASESVPPGVGTGGQTQIPYYDDVVLKQEVELTENIAYGPLR